MKRKTILMLCCFVCFYAVIAYACPTCSELIVRGKDAFKTMKFGEGIAWSIALFFLVPVLMIGGMIYAIYRTSQKAKQKEAAREAK